ASSFKTTSNRPRTFVTWSRHTDPPRIGPDGGIIAMAPLIVMLAAWLVARSIGATGLWLQADTWTGALRIALAVMFVFTAVSHFHPRMRPDLIRMVPPSLPAPALLVSATGVLELLGAFGLMVPRAMPAAAFALIALLVAMFPANVHAAREGLMIGGRRATPLL